jgi:hypothetical protein
MTYSTVELLKLFRSPSLFLLGLPGGRGFIAAALIG